MNILKYLFGATSVCCCLFTFAQENRFDEEEIKEDFLYNLNIYSEAYTAPVLDVVGTNLINGWDEGAATLPFGGVRLTFHAALTFIPEEEITFNFYDQAFTGNMSLVDPTKPYLPTAIGGKTDKMFVYTIEDNQGRRYSQQVEVLSGALLPVNAIPNIVPQISVGLPFGFEISGRIFPYVDIENVRHQEYGGALKYSLSQHFKDEDRFHWNIGAVYNANSFSYTPRMMLEGVDQEISLSSKAWLVQTVGSYDWEHFGVFGSLAYYDWTSAFNISGLCAYTITEFGDLGYPEVKEAFSVKDPVNISHQQAALRYTVGVTLRFLKRLSFSPAWHYSNDHSVTANLSLTLGKLNDFE